MLILLLKTKKSRQELKKKKWWNIYKVSFKKKNKIRIGENRLLKLRRGKWENICLNKLKKNGKNKSKKEKLIRSKQRFGKKIRVYFSKIKKRNRNTWKMSIRNMKMSFWHKWKISRIKSRKKKWTPSNFFTIKLSWKRLPRILRI